MAIPPIPEPRARCLGLQSLLRTVVRAKISEELKRVRCLLAKWMPRYPLLTSFIIVHAALTSYWIHSVLSNSACHTALRLVGGLLPVILGTFVMGFDRPLNLPRSLRCAIAFANFSVMVGISSSVFAFGGLDYCVSKLHTEFVRIGQSQDTGVTHEVHILLDLACAWIECLLAMRCLTEKRTFSLFGARTLWCLEMLWMAHAVDVLVAVMFLCSGRHAKELHPEEVFLVGIADIGSGLSTVLIWLLVFARLQNLELALPEYFKTRIVHSLLTVCAVLLGMINLCTMMSAWKANAACLAVGGAILASVAIMTSRRLYKVWRAMRKERRGIRGLLLKEALWAGQIFRAELAAVLVTGLSSTAHLFWRAYLNWTWGDGEYLEMSDSSSRAVAALDFLCNASCLAVMCGVFLNSRPSHRCEQRCERKSSQSFCIQGSIGNLESMSDAGDRDVEVARSKVIDIAHRGFRLEKLLDFYAELISPSSPMPTYDRHLSSTNDVVREAIIPMSRFEDGSGGSALATKWNEGQQILAEVMVTHAWSNLFLHLVAAVVADGCGCSTYDAIAAELVAGDTEKLKCRLRARNALQTTVWICAFCVNQHASICGGFGNGQSINTVSQQVYPVCTCQQPKYFNDQPADCELNKFDKMMAFLSYYNPAVFRQVVACDKSFDLTGRAWCIAELVEAYNCNISQTLVVHSDEGVDEHHYMLKQLDIRECKASRPEDVTDILSKILDIDAFNDVVYELIFGEDGLFKQWSDRETQLENAGHLAARILRMPSGTSNGSRKDLASRMPSGTSNGIREDLESGDVVVDVDP